MHDASDQGLFGKALRQGRWFESRLRHYFESKNPSISDVGDTEALKPNRDFGN